MNPHLTRPIYWNVEYAEPFMIPIGILLIGILAYGLYRKYREWQSLGQPEIRWDRPMQRLARIYQTGFGQLRVARRKYAGTTHLLIFIGFALLFVGTCLVALERDIGQQLLGIKPVAFLYGHFYSIFSFTLDIAGVMVIVGCLMALYRRAVLRPKHQGGKPGYLFWTVFLLVVSLTGFYVEGTRIAESAFVIEGEGIVPADPSLERWVSPVGYLVSRILPNAAIAPEVQHAVIWWAHAFLSFAFLFGFAFGVLRHAFTGLANLYFAPFESSGTLKLIPNMDEAEVFGVSTVDQFIWKRLFDSEACVACGRCDQHCPALITGKPLSPKRIMLGIHAAREDALAAIAAQGKGEVDLKPIVDNYISQDELWSCTTCGACMQQCPVYIEHIPAIVDLRRSLVMMESDFPEEVQITFENLENQGNPWGLDNESRADWGKDLEVPTLAEVPDPEVLFWVGCAGSFDVRAKPTSRALVKILNRAGVKFAILGSEERCCGDPARRVGHEYLYKILAEMAVETLNGYEIKKIVTTCPHCFHTLLNEFPQLGGHYEVLHHTEYINQLLESGRLKLPAENGASGSAVYHDSCYLGRHNDVYEDPRALVEKAGLQKVEMPRGGKESFCCGAGGGRMWMEEHLGHKKVNIERSEEAISTGADRVAVACPFCKTMLSDGVKEKNREDLAVLDVAELIAARLPD
jgi:Fe-S oxidoreductase